MAKKKNKGDAMDTSIDETDAPEGTGTESNGEEQQPGTEQQLDADTGTESNGEEQQPAPSAGEDKPAESTGEDNAADDLDEDMAAEVVAVRKLYEELTGGGTMPLDYSMSKVVRDAWATKRPGKHYPGYRAALTALTGCEV